MEKVIKIEYHSDKIEKLTYIDGKSDWIDLRAAERVELKAGDFKLINLGVSMRIPEGYEELLRRQRYFRRSFRFIERSL